MFSKETIIDKIELLEDGTMQVRRATYVLEDGVRITEPRYSRVVHVPGADIGSEHATVKAVGAVVWTPDVVQTYRDKQVGPPGADKETAR